MTDIAIRKSPFNKYNPIGLEEESAAIRTIRSGVLSGFVGAWCPEFNGGPQVQSMEREFASHFGVRHAISVNSWTSGLIAAIGALGLDPGDEVIVSPWTMSATATAILIWNCVPVFADIDEETFCISPESVRKLITPRTKAIIAVDIFGQSADNEQLLEICHEFKLFLVSDTAQAPNAKRNNEYAGTKAHIGGISLNYHKHIHCGEGGVIFTNDDQLALRMKLIRNHGEVAISNMSENELPEVQHGIIGYNFRLGEIEASIAREQLKKLSRLTALRSEVAKKITNGLQKFEGLILPRIDQGNSHVFYMYPIKLNFDILNKNREEICEELEKAGLFPLERGYENLHLLSIYKKLNAFGKSEIPWSLDPYFNKSNYEPGSCPVAERLDQQELFLLPINNYEFSNEDIIDVIKIFEYVWNKNSWKMKL